MVKSELKFGELRGIKRVQLFSFINYRLLIIDYVLPDLNMVKNCIFTVTSSCYFTYKSNSHSSHVLICSILLPLTMSFII